MTVYDFDNTIYAGDSTLDFWGFCLKKYPKTTKHLPFQLLSFLLYNFKIIKKKQFKERFYSFLRDVDDINNSVELFWNENSKKIKQWYLKVQNEEDVIITASPYFLIKEVSRYITSSNIIASIVDERTGKCISENCYGKEKVRRFRAKYGEDMRIEKFYTDSLSDLPMAKISNKSFLVQGNKLVIWKVGCEI